MTTVEGVAALSTGLLLGRLVFGALMIAHGGQKLFGWLGGYGIAGTGGFFEQLGFRPGKFFAVAAGLAELGGGLLLALGLLGPVGPALIVSIMIVAAATVHWKNGLFATSQGIEVTLLYATAALMFALVGSGRYSADVLLGLDRLWTPGAEWAILAVGVIGGVANLALRRTAARVPHTA